MTYQPQLIHLSVSDALQSAFVSSFRFPMPIERAAVSGNCKRSTRGRVQFTESECYV